MALDRYGREISVNPHYDVVVGNDGVPLPSRRLLRLGSGITSTDQPDSDSTLIDASGGASTAITSLIGDITGTGPGAATTTIGAKKVTYSKIQDVAAGSVLGNPTGSAGTVQEIPATAAGLALLAGANAAAQRTSLGLGSMATQSASAVAISGGTITGMPTPTASSDVASKSYVDSIATGLSWKTSVVVATTANGALTSAYANGQTVDGYTLVTGDRVLLKNQSSATENGIYVVAASGAPTRATDANTGTSLISAAVFVQQGTANADLAFVCTNNSIVLGVTNIVFVSFTSATGAVLAGNNLSDLTSASTARINLGLAIGTNVQAYSANLNSSTTAGAAILQAASAAAQRTAMGVAIGTDVQSYSANLSGSTSAGGALLQAASAVAQAQLLGSEIGVAGSNLGNSNATLTVAGGNDYTLPASTLSTTRTITLGVTGSPLDGEIIRINRRDTSSNTLVVQDSASTTLFTFPASTKVIADFRYNASTSLFEYSGCKRTQ